jgi:hypothetical protein
MNFKKTYFLIAKFILLGLVTTAQECITGDCQNGYGTYLTFDKKLIEGNFKNEEIDGFYMLTEAYEIPIIGYQKNGIYYGKYYFNRGSIKSIFDIEKNKTISLIKQTPITTLLPTENPVIETTIRTGNFEIIVSNIRPIKIIEYSDSLFNEERIQFTTNGNSYQLHITMDETSKSNLMVYDQFSNKTVLANSLENEVLETQSPADKLLIERVNNNLSKFQNTYTQNINLVEFEKVRNEAQFINLHNKVLTAAQVTISPFMLLYKKVIAAYNKLNKNSLINNVYTPPASLWAKNHTFKNHIEKDGLDMVHQQAKYNGGVAAIKLFLEEIKFDYSLFNKGMFPIKIVEVLATVETDGTLAKTAISTILNAQENAEIWRAIKLMPKFLAAKFNNKAVRSMGYFSIPVTK